MTKLEFHRTNTLCVLSTVSYKTLADGCTQLAVPLPSPLQYELQYSLEGVVCR